MDFFQYSLAMDKIDKLKTLKAKDVFIRECFRELSNGSDWVYHSTLQGKPIQEISMLYKCITKTLQSYDKNRLPDKIIRGINEAKDFLINDMCDNPVSYETFIDTFQFIPHLICPRLTTTQVSSLATIYADNPMTFTIAPNMDVSDKFLYIIENLPISYNYNICKILQIEELKRALPDNIRYTILENLLDAEYEYLLRQQDLDITDVISSMENLVTVANTMQRRLNGPVHF